MVIVLFIIGVLAFLFGSFKAIPDNKEWWLLPIYAGVVWIALAVFLFGQAKKDEMIAKEVDLKQVSISGQKNFRAQVQIIYKDGKLDQVVLVPKTTVPEVVVAK